MKKALILLAILSSTICMAQEIKKSEIDDFTGNKLIETSWQRINYSTKGYCTYLNLSLLNQKQYLGVKIITMSVCSIIEDSEILFKAKDGNVYKLKAVETAISAKGEGAIGMQGAQAEGIYVRYSGDLSFLGSIEIDKIRVYTRNQYLDIDVTDKYKDKIMKMYQLFENEIK